MVKYLALYHVEGIPSAIHLRFGIKPINRTERYEFEARDDKEAKNMAKEEREGRMGDMTLLIGSGCLSSCQLELLCEARQL